MGRIEVKVTPRSSQNKIEVTEKGIKVWVTAAPADGQANAAVCALLAEKLKLAKSSIVVVKGLSGRQKTIEVERLESLDIIDLLSR